MAQMFIIVAETGEYADKRRYNVFVCTSMEHADTCLRAIDNWFQLQGHDKTAGKHMYCPVDCSSNTAEAFEQQFGVYISIDYTGIEFSVEPVEVYGEQGA